jgi:hypothetical protein
MKTKLPTFNVGDRVQLSNPHARIKLPNMNNGIIVKYQGEHDPKMPRVRWASGWGISSKAKDLRLMTAEEIAALPVPLTMPIDK